MDIGPLSYFPATPSTPPSPPATEGGILEPPTLRLSSLGIPPDREEKLINRYNRLEFPIMEDEAFSDLLAEIAKSTSSANVESELERRVKAKNAVLNDDYERVKYQIHMKGRLVLSTAQERKIFTSVLRASSINATKTFIAYVLPSMVQSLESVTTPIPANNNRPQAKSTSTAGRHRRSTNANRKRRDSSKTTRTLSTPKDTSKPRRSPRIAARQTQGGIRKGYC